MHRSAARRVSLVAIRWLALLAAVNLPGASLVLTPVADTGLSQFGPAVNFGGEIDFVAGAQGPSANNAINRGLVRFDFSSLPAEATILSAQLALSVHQSPLNAPSASFSLHRALVDWDEMNATWLERQPDTAWNDVGAGGAADAADTVSAAQMIGGISDYTFGPAPGLVADVQFWLSHPTDNRGWLVRTDDESLPRSARRFSSRETALGTPPRLTIEYTTPEPLRIDRVEQQGDLFLLHFIARPGKAYVIQCREQLENGDWVNCASLPATSSGGAMVFSETALRARRFYRLCEQ